GFRAHIVRFLQDQVTVIVLTNGSEAKPDTVALDVARNYIPSLLPRKARLDELPRGGRVADDVLEVPQHDLPQPAAFFQPFIDRVGVLGREGAVAEQYDPIIVL